MLLAPMDRERARIEYLDRPDVDPGELAESLGDIARLNRIGPIRALLADVAPFFERFQATGPKRPLRVLDLGTGGADVPSALVGWARARGHRVTVVGLDVQPQILACAVPRDQRPAELRLVAGDALRPPIRPGGVDLALCSLTLHHLPEEAVIALLRLMADLASLGFVVSDLRRSRPAYLAAWLATRLISRNRLTRHDGPLSVRRAYTPSELARLSARAGLATVHWHRAAFVRVLGVYARDAG
jgi:2-polyprenyl-3-methyl-5-hydroxy-6-metoxy-1,4-benzoquinol methylase